MDSRAAYLVQAAQQAGYDPANLATIMAYESGLNPARWGGKGGQYAGLIQFGPAERKQFGVDMANPNFNNQVDSAINFLQARGYKPNMGMMDMYSTVLAGSPGHYNRADQNGTVAGHVSQMDNARKMAMNFLGGSYTPPAQGEQPEVAQAAVAEAAKPAVEQADTNSLLSKTQVEGLNEAQKSLSSLLSPQQEEQTFEPAQMMQMPQASAQAYRPSKALLDKIRQRGLLG